MISEDRLANWAWYCLYGHIGPEVRKQCASAEGNYIPDGAWESHEPHYEPDLLDGELVEDAIRQLPDISRRVLKAKYVSFPYHRSHTVAQRLRMSVDRLESELRIAKRRLTNELERDRAGDYRVAESPFRLSDSFQSK